ncbi:hypothetical protein L1987_30872 [Smallanthus sonchifolius]|uniref:Uncharacterized protein n=1 Tax=Smallanthus sonchifolius TaxID=185202 RepID=A0ACB9I4N9_9ASTR|nr:hypothetical protein L1987_30872 [Smallanthus sonchifolius]
MLGLDVGFIRVFITSSAVALILSNGEGPAFEEISPRVDDEITKARNTISFDLSVKSKCLLLHRPRLCTRNSLLNMRNSTGILKRRRGGLRFLKKL